MSNEAKVEMVPMLQDMRTYITNHYWSEILCEVEEQLPGFKAQMPPWTQGTQLFLHHEESKIVKADFWRRSRTKMSADLYVRLKIGASKNGELPTLFRGKHVFEYGFCAGRDDSVAVGINRFIG